MPRSGAWLLWLGTALVLAMVVGGWANAEGGAASWPIMIAIAGALGVLPPLLIRLHRQQHQLAEQEARRIAAETQLADQLRQHDTMLFRLGAQLPGVMFQYRRFPNGSHCFPYISSGFSDVLGIHPESLRDDASSLFRLAHPEDSAGLKAALQRSAVSMEREEFEFQVRLPSGMRWRQVVARPEQLPDGSTLWHGFFWDITERKRDDGQPVGVLGIGHEVAQCERSACMPEARTLDRT